MTEVTRRTALGLIGAAAALPGVAVAKAKDGITECFHGIGIGIDHGFRTDGHFTYVVRREIFPDGSKGPWGIPRIVSRIGPEDQDET